MSEKMICGHHFEVRKRSENSSTGSEEKNRKLRRNTAIAACGLFNKKHRKRCGQEQIKLHGQTMWSEQRTTYHSFLRRCCIITLLQAVVKAPLKIKFKLKIWYAVNKEKARSDHLHHQGANPSAHTWWRWSHFAFRSIKTPVRTQKLICSKQRKGDQGSDHRRWNGYISVDINKRIVLRNREVGIAKNNLDKTRFLLEIFRNWWYNVRCRIINSKKRVLRGAKWQ